MTVYREKRKCTAELEKAARAMQCSSALPLQRDPRQCNVKVKVVQCRCTTIAPRPEAVQFEREDSARAVYFNSEQEGSARAVNSAPHLHCKNLR
jgi:hypothetical protein